MRVTLRSQGSTVAEVELDGPLLVRPGGTRVVSRTTLATVLEVVGEGCDVPDLMVGSVPLAWWEPSSGSVNISFLDVPPPPPFGASDVSGMWSDVLASSIVAVKSVPLQGRGDGRARRQDSSWLRPEAIPRAIAACRRLLSDWPELEATATVWRPPDMRGPPEDLTATDRRAAMKPGTISAGVAIPDQVARRQRSSTPWRSNRLAHACRTVVLAMDELGEDVGSPGWPIRPIRSVAERAATNRRIVDPPLSSWPQIALSTLGVVLEARVSLVVSGEGSGRVPLCHVWRLYESWLATAVIDALNSAWGQGYEVSAGSSEAWQWDVGPVVVRVHSQATIGAERSSDLCGHPDGLLSVLSDLRPDVLVTVSNPQGTHAILCIDAKHRTSLTTMHPSEVASSAAKYVWGIRSGADRGVPLGSAIIASSAPLEDMHDVDRARVSTSFALPSNRESFDALVARRVRALVTAVDAK